MSSLKAMAFSCGRTFTASRSSAMQWSTLRRRKYVNVALLIIDEVGFEPMNRQEASLLFRLVSYRYC